MDPSRPAGSLPLFVFASVLFVGAGITYRVHVTQPYSRPPATFAAFFAGASAANLARVERASFPNYYVAFVSHFGEMKRARVGEIYKYVYQLGLPQWQQYSWRAQTAANLYYEQLHERVDALGRAAFGRLTIDERMVLIEDRSRYDTFIFEQGLKALPADDRQRIHDPDAFRQRRDRSGFVQREGWSLLPPEDREALGSAAALSQEETREKLTFIDRVGIQLLNRELRQEIEGIPRAELQDAAGFDFKYGKPLAQAFLQHAKIPPMLPERCQFPQADVSGSLFRGEAAACSIKVQLAGQQRAITLTVTLEKDRFNWLVRAVEPALYDIAW